MTDREKVLQGLYCCAANCQNGCPYSDISQYCSDVLAKDALELIKKLIKAQEPRVMGVGDIYGEDMGFYERKYEELVWPVLIARGGPDDDGTVGIVRKDAFEIKADCGLMNQTWRIWTAYPTDEQRKAVPWDD